MKSAIRHGGRLYSNKVRAEHRPRAAWVCAPASSYPTKHTALRSRVVNVKNTQVNGKSKNGFSTAVGAPGGASTSLCPARSAYSVLAAFSLFVQPDSLPFTVSVNQWWILLDNVELTGAAQLYRAASSDRRERCERVARVPRSAEAGRISSAPARAHFRISSAPARAH